MRKNKIFTAKRIILLFLLVILNSILIVGITYSFAVSNFFKNITTHNQNFRLVYTMLDERKDKNEAIKELNENEHIIIAYSTNNWNSYATIMDFKNLNFTGEITVHALPPNVEKIIYGDDLNDDELSIICPENFFPENPYIGKKYDSRRIINIKNMVGDNIKLNYLDKGEFEVKLSGVFDRGYSYSEANMCYMTPNSIKKMNEEINNDEEIDNNVLILLDDAKNINILDSYEFINSSNIVARIKIEILTNIIKVIGLIAIPLIMFVIIICYLFTNREIIKEYKNIGISRILGYSKIYIKSKYYKEHVVIVIVSTIISYFISNYILSNFVTWFLYNEQSLSLINLEMNYIILFISFIIILFTSLIATYVSLKKIDDLDIGEIINE